MRQRLITFLFAFFAVNAMMNAETVQLSFSGVTTEGRYCLLDSVKIENLTQNWSQTLDCCIDTTYELPVAQVPTGIDNIAASDNEDELLSISQNFAIGNTLVTINPLNNGVVRMRVMDMIGRVIIEHAEYLSAGYHQYSLQLGIPQAYMPSVITDAEHASAKILNITSSGRYDLSRVTSLPTTYQSPRKARAAGADLMQYTGYTNQKGIAVASEPITQYQSSPEQIVFHFAPVAKGQEGMYVGILGFNNALYPYSFDILTSSNLYAHQNFVSNLTMANGTILYHAVYTSLDNIVNAPVPEKLENVSIVTFTDGLDIGSWRMNSNYPSEALYLAAVNKQIHRTYIDGIKLDAYSIGVKGSDVTDEVRFENDLHQLASDSANVFSVSNMDEVNARFREIAAKIYNTKVNYAMTIKLPAPDPGSIIRFTFDNVTDANNSIYYIEGTYDYDFGANIGILKDVIYSGVKCSNGSTWTSVPDGIFDIFTIHNIATNLGERVSTSYMHQWSYIPTTNSWQINSEFDPSSNSSSSEERTSALVMLVLDCSSSLGSDFSQMQSAANNFLRILAGKGNISKPTVSSANVKLGDLQVTLSASMVNTGNLSITGKGFCVSEHPNMDNAVFYYIDAEDEFEYLLTDLIEGKTYYVRSFAENQLGRTYGNISSFIAVTATLPEVSLISTDNIDVDKIICTGQVTFDGNAPIIEKGFCWSLTPNPTIDDNLIILDTNTETFKDTINGLGLNTEIYIRAYAKNKKGICYSTEDFNTAISAIFYTAKQKINLSSDFNKEILCHNFKEGEGTIIFRQKLSSIESDAFRYTGLTSVTIPNSVTSIGEGAFFGCSSMTSITIPNSVTSIGLGAFGDCTGLTSPVYNAHIFAFMPTSYSGAYTIPDGIESIAGGAFNGCNGLTSVTIPNSVTSIGKGAFYGCSSMTSITIPNSVTSIGSSAFDECYALTAVHISDLAAWCKISFGSESANPLSRTHTLYLNGKLVTDLVIPNSVTSIERNAFYHCTSLTSVTIPNSVTSIGNSAFYRCSALKSIEISNNVTTIGGSAFGYCSSLKSIEIPNSVTSIERNAFGECTGLTSIEIPNSVTSIGQDAFYDCSKIAYITSKATTPPICNYSTFNTISTSIPVYVPAESVDAYKNAIGWQSFTNIFPDTDFGVIVSGTCGVDGDNLIWKLSFDSVLTISGTGAMPEWTSQSLASWSKYRPIIKSVILPQELPNITSYALYGCTGLKSIEIPSNVTSLGENAFQNCGNLSSVEIPNSVTSIGSNAFDGCTALTSIDIPNSVTSIGSSSFSGCIGLTSVTIPNGVTTIGGSAFSGCCNLTSVTIPNSVTSIGSNAFDGCTALTSIDIPNSVTSIGSSSFSGCIGLTSVTIPNGVTTIGGSAFSGCCNLTSVIIPNSVTSIGKKAFSDCTGLTSVTIDTDSIVDGSPSPESIFGTQVKEYILGNNVTSIGSFAFSGCSNLTSVTIGDNVTSIGYQAFISCTSLTSITIPNSVTSIGSNAFYNCNKVASITCKVTTPPDCGTSTFYNISTSIPVYVPAESVSTYKSAAGWKSFTKIQAIP